MLNFHFSMQFLINQTKEEIFKSTSVITTYEDVTDLLSCFSRFGTICTI